MRSGSIQSVGVQAAGTLNEDTHPAWQLSGVNGRGERGTCSECVSSGHFIHSISVGMCQGDDSA